MLSDLQLDTKAMGSEDGCQCSTVVIHPAIVCSNPRSILAKCESNPYASTEHFVLLFYSLDIPLFFLDFGIFSHVFEGSEVIVVTRVNFRIESGHEGCWNGS